MRRGKLIPDMGFTVVERDSTVSLVISLAIDEKPRRWLTDNLHGVKQGNYILPVRTQLK